MSHHRSHAQRIAIVSLGTLLFITTTGIAQEASGTSSKPAAARSQATDKKQAKPSAGKPADKPKDDIDSEIDAKLKAREKKKEERKPNFEIKVVRTSPSDSITYFKPYHWTQFHHELIANNSDETVELRTATESLLEAMDTPHAVQYRRLVHLLKEQAKMSRLPVFLPDGRKGNKTLESALYHPDGVLPIQPPGLDRTTCTVLEPDQFLIVTLSADPDNYRFLMNMQCIEPGSDVDDEPRDKRRYFAVVTHLQPTKPLVADTVLAWSTTAYVIWDDLDPGLLSAWQQEALIDWLHLGGQLIVSGGSAATRLEQSFLAPYLPADVVGSAQITDMNKVSGLYPTPRTYEKKDPRRLPIPINPNRPVYFAKLSPRPDADEVEDSDLIGDLPVVVERRVGRGRIVMAAFSLYQPELVKDWKDGYDTFWRQRLFKIDETMPNPSFQLGGSVARSYIRLPARKLSRLRLLSRDFGAGTYRQRPAAPEKAKLEDEIAGARVLGLAETGELPSEKESVAAWRDTTPVPNAARQTLLAATGIKIPPPDFVLAAAISYLVVLVPINWLVCRFGLRRPELAWLSAPVIILAFSVGIVRFARVNVGYDSTSHEIDVVELFAGYPRAHVSRFTCVYSGSRARYQFRYDDPSALALPLSVGDVQRGKNVDRIYLDWDMTAGFPVTLGRYEVHPRSIGMVRAEEMKTIAGPFRLLPSVSAGQWSLDNQTGFELWDCRLVRSTEIIRLGDVKPGEHLQYPPAPQNLAEPAAQPSEESDVHRIFAANGPMAGRSTTRELGDLSPWRLLELLEDRTQEPGTRLVGWAPKTVPGQHVDPKSDQAIGFTIFVVHLNKL